VVGTSALMDVMTADVMMICIRSDHYQDVYHVPPENPVQPLRFTKFGGVELVDIPLPGDEDSIIKYRVKLSIKRDDRLNKQEHRVYICELMRLRYGTRVCLALDCDWCGGGGWTPREFRESNLYDQWP
jgi:hypothetical protein